MVMEMVMIQAKKAGRASRQNSNCFIEPAPSCTLMLVCLYKNESGAVIIFLNVCARVYMFIYVVHIVGILV